MSQSSPSITPRLRTKRKLQYYSDEDNDFLDKLNAKPQEERLQKKLRKLKAENISLFDELQDPRRKEHALHVKLRKLRSTISEKDAALLLAAQSEESLKAQLEQTRAVAESKEAELQNIQRSQDEQMALLAQCSYFQDESNQTDSDMTECSRSTPSLENSEHSIHESAHAAQTFLGKAYKHLSPTTEKPTALTSFLEKVILSFEKTNLTLDTIQVQLRNKDAELATLRTDAAATELALQEKTAKITTLQTDAAATKLALQEKTDEITTMRIHAAATHDILQEKTDEITSTRAELQQKDHDYRSLKVKFSQLNYDMQLKLAEFGVQPPEVLHTAWADPISTVSMDIDSTLTPESALWASEAMDIHPLPQTLPDSFFDVYLEENPCHDDFTCV